MGEACKFRDGVEPPASRLADHNSEARNQLMVSLLTGVSLSGDATFKVTKKATVVNAKKQRLDLIAGGCFSLLNEDQKIIKWVSQARQALITQLISSFASDSCRISRTRRSRSYSWI